MYCAVKNTFLLYFIVEYKDQYIFEDYCRNFDYTLCAAE